MKLLFSEELRGYFPAEVDIQASTPLDALSLIATQHPLAGKIKPIPVRFLELDNEELLNDPTLNNKTFTIVPVNSQELKEHYQHYSGGGGSSKNTSWIQIVIGVVLIVVGAMTSWAGGAMLIQIGIGLVISGLMMLLAPTISESEQLNKKSRVFSGNKTTSEIGTPIQMIFGEHRAYAHLLSFNLEARNYDGIDQPDTSPYFKGKADETLPTINVNKFYGVVRAGDTTKISQLDVNVNRTGTDVQ